MRPKKRLAEAMEAVEEAKVLGAQDFLEAAEATETLEVLETLEAEESEAEAAATWLEDMLFLFKITILDLQKKLVKNVRQLLV